jgi:hypothetical protein
MEPSIHKELFRSLRAQRLKSGNLARLLEGSKSAAAPNSAIVVTFSSLADHY